VISTATAREDSQPRVFRRVNGLVTRTILDETLVVPVKGNLAEMDRIFSLSGAAAAIWEGIDGETSLDSLCRLVGERFDAPGEVIAADMREFVESLLQAGLIVERS
jgi:hypothetical protein